VITLSSDFGTPYPAAMKGVILQHSDIRLIDVSHELPRQNVRAAAFWIREMLPSFPPAVHLAVVDPGVGTNRAALVIRAGDHALVGPDNGLLIPVARQLASETGVEPVAFEWRYDDPSSHTFHGRDVFAPCAATVHETGIENIEMLDRATPANTYETLSLPSPEVSDAGNPTGEVLVTDGFGNVITNLPAAVLSGRYDERIHVNGVSAYVVTAYDMVETGERLVTVGSHGNVELAVNQGRGDRSFGLDPGAEVQLSF
jgi:S-adenosylmethionine hydrolase